MYHLFNCGLAKQSNTTTLMSGMLMPRYAPNRVPPVSKWKPGTFRTVYRIPLRAVGRTWNADTARLTIVKHIMNAQKHAVGCAFIACYCTVSTASTNFYPPPPRQTHPKTHLMLAVLRHKGIRHELWINQDLVMERIRLGPKLFVV